MRMEVMAHGSRNISGSGVRSHSHSRSGAVAGEAHGACRSNLTAADRATAVIHGPRSISVGQLRADRDFHSQ